MYLGMYVECMYVCMYAFLCVHGKRMISFSCSLYAAKHYWLAFPDSNKGIKPHITFSPYISYTHRCKRRGYRESRHHASSGCHFNPSLTSIPFRGAVSHGRPNLPLLPFPPQLHIQPQSGLFTATVAMESVSTAISYAAISTRAANYSKTTTLTLASFNWTFCTFKPPTLSSI